MNISGDVIVLGNKEVTAESQARITFGHKEGDMTRETSGCWRDPFLGLASDYKGAHFVKIPRALHLCWVYFSMLRFCKINS